MVTNRMHATRTALPRLLSTLLYAGLLLVAGNAACAETFLGRVVGISDGDTVTVLDADKTQHKIRLAGIDAPERKMPFGQRSKEHLSDLVFGKDVNVETSKKDRYGRSVAVIFVGVGLMRTSRWSQPAWRGTISSTSRNSRHRIGSFMPAQNCKRAPGGLVCGATTTRRLRGIIERSAVVATDQNAFPSTVEEAVRLLRGMVPEVEQARIAMMQEDELKLLHFGLGQWVRNHLGLWGVNAALLKATGEFSADDASGVIIHAFWQSLRDNLPKMH